MIPEKKKCSKCKKELPGDKFPTTKHNDKIYIKPYCLECNKAINREQYHKRKTNGDLKEEHYERDSFTVGKLTAF